MGYALCGSLVVFTISVFIVLNERIIVSLKNQLLFADFFLVTHCVVVVMQSSFIVDSGF